MLPSDLRGWFPADRFGSAETRRLRLYSFDLAQLRYDTARCVTQPRHFARDLRGGKRGPA